MLEQEGRAFHVPIIYPLKFFGGVFPAHSRFSRSASWPRPQVLQSIIFSTLSKNVALPTCPRVTPTKAVVLPLQVLQHSYIFRGQLLGSDQETPIPSHELLRCQAKTAQTHQCSGVSHNKFVLRFNLISPGGNFQPCLFSSLYLKPLLCISYCRGGWESLSPLLFSVRPKKCFVQFPNSGDGAVQKYQSSDTHGVSSHLASHPTE